jgi:glutathione S-transferase
MPFQYLPVEQALTHPGLRMVVVGNVPSPWGEAAKGIFHIKKIDWIAVRLAYDSEPLKQWTGGQLNGPIAFYEQERARSGWAEILLLAERLKPTPALLPADPVERTLAFGLAHEIFGEGGLCWTRRLQLVHGGMQDKSGFVPPVAKYLAKKYGYSQDAAASYGKRVTELLGMLTKRLKTQREAGSAYYVGKELTAVDIYSATAMALFGPLPHDQCEMKADTRAAFEALDEETKTALDPILFEHRDRIYAKHLELPLSL